MTDVEYDTQRRGIWPQLFRELMAELKTEQNFYFPILIYQGFLGVRTSVLNFRKHKEETNKAGFEYITTEQT